jgi:hypothetical protein
MKDETIIWTTSERGEILWGDLLEGGPVEDREIDGLITVE